MRFNWVWCILFCSMYSQISYAKEQTVKLASRLANGFWVYDDPTTQRTIVFKLSEHSSNKNYYFYHEWQYDCNDTSKPLHQVIGVPTSDNGLIADFYIPSGYRMYRPFLTQLHLVKLKPKKYVILSKKTPDGMQKYQFDYQTENKAKCQFKS